MAKSLATRKRGTNKKVLVIGDSGSGKTTLLSTFPKLLVMDFDNGLDSIAGVAADYEDYFDPPGAKPTAWPRAKKLLETLHKEFQDDKCEYETVAVDSITRAADAALAWVLDKKGRSSGTIQIGDWGEAISEVKEFLGKVTTLPCHVVVTAHFQMVKDDSLGGLYFVPLLYGKDLPPRIPMYFNDVWRTFIDQKVGSKEYKHRLQIKPSTRFNTLKNSFGDKLNTDDGVVEPDFQQMMASISEEA